MTTLYEGAFAKLNLTLDVLGKREDGYHDLQSVMQAISIRDDIEIDVGTGKPWKLLCTAEGIPTDERNLAWKAARVYCDVLKKDPNGLEIRINKRIPSGAGMGGGSADAAAVLRALNRHYGEPLSVMALAELGAEIGSDEYALAGICCLDDADYLLLGIFHHLLPADVAIGVGRARIEQTQIVIDLCYRADGRAGIAVGGLLLDGDYRRQSRNLVYVGPLHVAEKVARIGREGLYIPALSLSEDGVESQ